MILYYFLLIFLILRFNNKKIFLKLYIYIYICKIVNKEKYHEKNNNLIEQEQTEEEIYKVAHKILDSNNKLPEIHINKNVKDSYTELNNVSDFDELKEGEDINRIINLPIKYKK